MCVCAHFVALLLLSISFAHSTVAKCMPFFISLFRNFENCVVHKCGISKSIKFHVYLFVSAFVFVHSFVLSLPLFFLLSFESFRKSFFLLILRIGRCVWVRCIDACMHTLLSFLKSFVHSVVVMRACVFQHIMRRYECYSKRLSHFVFDSLWLL